MPSVYGCKGNFDLLFCLFLVIRSLFKVSTFVNPGLNLQDRVTVEFGRRRTFLNWFSVPFYFIFYVVSLCSFSQVSVSVKVAICGHLQ